MKISPKWSRVLIRRETLKKGVIEIPETVHQREAPARGEIVALGKTVGVWDQETGKVMNDLKVGDQVIFGRHAGTEIELGSEKFWLVEDKDILCSIDEE